MQNQKRRGNRIRKVIAFLADRYPVLYGSLGGETVKKIVKGVAQTKKTKRGKDKRSFSFS